MAVVWPTLCIFTSEIMHFRCQNHGICVAETMHFYALNYVVVWPKPYHFCGQHFTFVCPKLCMPPLHGLCLRYEMQASVGRLSGLCPTDAPLGRCMGKVVRARAPHEVYTATVLVARSVGASPRQAKAPVGPPRA